MRTQKTILVVDDFEDFFHSTVGELRDWGYKVVIARDGQQGLEMFLTARPDLVVTNIHMPRMNGLQLLRAIKKVSPDTPVILTTGFAHYRRFFPGKAEKADAFFEKPIDMGEFLQRIDGLLASNKTDE